MGSIGRSRANPVEPVRKAKGARVARPGREEGLGPEDEPALRVLGAPTVRLVPME